MGVLRLLSETFQHFTHILIFTSGKHLTDIVSEADLSQRTYISSDTKNQKTMRFFNPNTIINTSDKQGKNSKLNNLHVLLDIQRESSSAFLITNTYFNK